MDKTTKFFIVFGTVLFITFLSIFVRMGTTHTRQIHVKAEETPKQQVNEEKANAMSTTNNDSLTKPKQNSAISLTPTPTELLEEQRSIGGLETVEEGTQENQPDTTPTPTLTTERVADENNNREDVFRIQNDAVSIPLIAIQEENTGLTIDLSL